MIMAIYLTIRQGVNVKYREVLLEMASAKIGDFFFLIPVFPWVYLQIQVFPDICFTLIECKSNMSLANPSEGVKLPNSSVILLDYFE